MVPMHLRWSHFYDRPKRAAASLEALSASNAMAIYRDWRTCYTEDTEKASDFNQRKRKNADDAAGHSGHCR